MLDEGRDVVEIFSTWPTSEIDPNVLLGQLQMLSELIGMTIDWNW